MTTIPALTGALAAGVAWPEVSHYPSWRFHR